MDLQSIVTPLIAPLVIGVLIARHLRWRELDPAHVLRLPVVLGGIGLLTMADLHGAAPRCRLRPRADRRRCRRAAGGLPRAHRSGGGRARAACAGAANLEIAATLFLGAATVKSYVTTILAKLGVPSRPHAIALVLIG